MVANAGRMDEVEALFVVQYAQYYFGNGQFQLNAKNKEIVGIKNCIKNQNNAPILFFHTFLSLHRSEMNFFAEFDLRICDEDSIIFKSYFKKFNSRKNPKLYW